MQSWKYTLPLLFTLLSLNLPGQETSKLNEWLRTRKIALAPSVGIQLWSSYTLGAQVYDVGIFNPRQSVYNGVSAGTKYAPLFTVRAVLYVGDPEAQHYSTGHKVNYFGQRNGLSLALAAAHQGATERYRNNTVIGGDFLFNWGAWSLDGEWHQLSRTNRTEIDNSIQSIRSDVHTGYLRVSYTQESANAHFSEPVLMFVFLDGATDEMGQVKAAALQTFAGQEQIWDIGINYYLNPDLKFSLHYTHRHGEAGFAGEGATVNNYFFQPGVGAIQRGDWLGLGLGAIL